MAEQSLPRTDTGSLAEDLRANARLVVRTLTDPRQGALFTAVVVAPATCDPRAAEALHRFYAVRIGKWSGCVEAAVARGQLPAGTDPGEVVAAAPAPLYYRLLASGAPLDEAAADRAADAAAAAARAGSCPAQGRAGPARRPASRCPEGRR
ncbi:hypothetical protein SCYAM73S_03852 [Streptomyces cyaneofuscatus]